MYNRVAQQSYKAAKFSTVDRGRLLMMMYDGALNFLKHAKTAIESNDRMKFAVYISKATAVISELNNTLDYEAGGDAGREIAQELSALYDFMLFHLTRANIQRDAKKVGEVIKVLETITAAFREIFDKGDVDLAVQTKSATSPSSNAASKRPTEAEPQAQVASVRFSY